jgi:hypothetical protein
MRTTIEAQLHQILLDVVPGNFDSDAQGRIVAEAAASLLSLTRQASFGSPKRELSEEDMMTALFQAMERVAEADEVDEDEEEFPAHLDASGMSPEQVVRAASRLGDKAWGDMEIFNDDELDAMLRDDDSKDPYEFTFDDTTGRDDRFGVGRRHRSDGLTGSIGGA